MASPKPHLLGASPLVVETPVIKTAPLVAAPVATSYQNVQKISVKTPIIQHVQPIVAAPVVQHVQPIVAAPVVKAAPILATAHVAAYTVQAPPVIAAQQIFRTAPVVAAAQW